MSSSTHHRPGGPRRFSSQLRHFQHPSHDTSQGVTNASSALLSHHGRRNTYGTNVNSDLSDMSHSLHRMRTNSEVENMLEAQHEDEDHADSDGLYPPRCCWTSDTKEIPAKADPFRTRSFPVYYNIHRIRREVMNSIDDPYSLEQLKAPRLNISIVRPLVDQFYSTQDLSIVYSLLVNRAQFIREQNYATHHHTVNLTRALVCEIVAEKILRRYNEENLGPKGLLKLATILVAGFEPFQLAPKEVMERVEEERETHALHYMQKRARSSGGLEPFEKRLTALEIAIVSESKSFLASTACQKVVDAIYQGKVVYTPNSFIDIIPDHWKRRPISLYDPRAGPLLNQYRLIVPRTRNFIEIIHFTILLILYLMVMDGRESRLTTHYTTLEAVFDIYALGWILDQVATILEHGWKVYTQNLWVFLDVTFSGLFLFYFTTRMYAKHLAQTDVDTARDWARLALDALSCAAPVLIPRLAFNVMSENMVFLCLRSMMSAFITLLLLAIWCFAGFLLSLKWLHNGLHEEVVIGKWMIWIWFGLDGTGIDRAAEFHWLLGPVVMISFAFLGNSLFLTILVSMLSNTFSRISANSMQEILYRRSVLTFEGVKSDAIFAYMPPFNLMALAVMLPLKFVLSPRWFHKINVTVVKIINAPILILITLYERKALWIPRRNRSIKPKRIDWANANGPRIMSGAWWSYTLQFWDFTRFSVHGDIQAVFDQPPPSSPDDSLEDRDMSKRGVIQRNQSIGRSLKEGFIGQFGKTKRSEPLSTQTSSDNTVITGNVKKDPTGLSSIAPDYIIRDFGVTTGEPSTQKDENDADGDDESEDQPTSFQTLQRGARKDSMVEYSEEDVTAHEMNARLEKLEGSMQRIEALLLQLVDNPEDDDTQGAMKQVEEDAAEDADSLSTDSNA